MADRLKPSRVDIDKVLLEFAGSPCGLSLRDAGRRTPCATAEEVSDREWDDAARRQLLAHLLTCAVCAPKATEISRALLGRGHDHPSAALLVCYAGSAIPLGASGDRLRRQISTHLAGCAACRSLGDSSALEILEWSQLQKTVAGHEAVRALLVALSSVLVTKARKLQMGRVSRDAAGGATRNRGVVRAAGDDASAPVLDEKGNVVVDQAGRMRAVSFHIQKAEIDSGRGLYVALSTTDPEYRGTIEPVARVRIGLCFGSRCINFDPVDIVPSEPSSPYPSGLATLHAKLDAQISLKEVPVSHLVLTVLPRS